MWFRSRQTNQGEPPRASNFAGSGGVDRTIARLNIEHFRKLLSEESDEARRLMLLRLLEEEKAKLASLDRPPNRER